MRLLTRRLQAENWSFSRPEFAIDERGVGYALYCASGPQHTYTLVAFAHDIPDEARSDRVIATNWDATFTLFDGVPDAADIERLSRNVPVQEAGRLTDRELTLARANRSVRLWDHVVDALASGRQPDIEQIESVGYLMRTTAVYGSGKFGAVDRQSIAERPEFDAPFQAEMLTVYLIRSFVRDLVQHMGKVRGGVHAAGMNPGIASRLGIGNSTGLGMAPFLINHPQLFNNWITVREEALARVRNQPTASDTHVQVLLDLLRRSRITFRQWTTQHAEQAEKIARLNADIDLLEQHMQSSDMHNQYPWDRLFCWAQDNLELEAQECLVSLLMEPYPELVDGMSCCLSAPDESLFRIDGSMTLDVLRQQIETHYDWALPLDWRASEQCARAWYVSEEKLEPRLGERFAEPIEDYEQPLAPARDVASLFHALRNHDPQALVAEFLLQYPDYRYAVRRVQLLQQAPYAEIRDNTISASLMPIDMLRCKLAFFGATQFDPRSDRWLRICLYANAPYPEELASADADTWIYPPMVDH